MRFAPVVILSLLLVLTFQVDVSSAEPEISYFDVKIVDDDGNESYDILSHRYFIDTFSDASGTTFILRSQISLQASPANLLIESDGGTFNCYVHVANLSSYLSESGMRVQLNDEEEAYQADLRETNDFTSYVFSDDDDKMVLKPNFMYPISIMTLDDVEHEAPPEKVEDVVVSFTVHLKEGMHQIAFFSEGKLIEAYKLADGQSIRPLPTVEREGYNFEGWFLKSGEPIQEGYVVTADDGDFISYAKWSEAGSGSHRTDINWIILLLIIALIIGMIIMILAYRRRRSSG